MDTVKKLVAEDRTFDALQTLIPMAQGGDPPRNTSSPAFITTAMSARMTLRRR